MPLSTTTRIKQMTVDHQTATEFIKASPSVAVGGLTLFGVGLADWVLLLTLVYTALQISLLVRDKIWRHYRGSKRDSIK